MTNDDYLEILAFIREQLRENQLGGVEERLFFALKGREGAFYDLVHYLRLLQAEIALGADDTLAPVLRRMRENVVTESGEPIRGIRLQFTEGDAERLQRSFIDLQPHPDFDRLASTVDNIILEIETDYETNRERLDGQ